MGEIEEALARVAETIRAKGDVPEDVIIGLEQLRGSVGRWLSASGAKLYVPAHCRWLVSPTGVHVDLGRRPTMRRIVTALVDARIETEGDAISSATLIGIGWPEDAAVTEASANRLRVTLCRLRQLGLEGVLVTTSNGWMLDPAVPILREDTSVDIQRDDGSGIYVTPQTSEELQKAETIVPLAS
jgi:hypothetical protein